MMRTQHAAIGMFICMVCAAYFILTTGNFAGRVTRHRTVNDSGNIATLLAFGDVNLGRQLGQMILNGAVHYTFEKMKSTSADIVFLNLESTLSEQHGETVSPASNLIFTGPPIGAKTLADAGITCVATANNHACDYGERALIETIENLDDANIAHIGSARMSENVFEPLCIEINGIRFAFFAVTDIMNMGGAWREHVASTDTAKLFPKIRETAQRADAVIVSVHGGDEYADTPNARMQVFMSACIRQGAAVVLGHHPHVPYGIEEQRGRYIVASLGNYVFHQPQKEWTQISYGVTFQFSKNDTTTTVSLLRIIPVAVGFQPSLISDTTVRGKLMDRMRHYSTISLKQLL